jgi:hypothetical protein
MSLLGVINIPMKKIHLPKTVHPVFLHPLRFLLMPLGAVTVTNLKIIQIIKIAIRHEIQKSHPVTHEI